MQTGNSGALFELSGTVPTNATWSEDIYFTQNGEPMDISGLSWKMSFRQSDRESSSGEFSIATSDGTLSVVADADGYMRVLRVSVAAGTFNEYCGDFIADLASKDVANQVDLWAHGVVTFRPNPVVF